MKRIGILGGTFNPVHAGHVSLVSAALKELDLDKLIVMPTFLSPHKTLIAASPEDRVNMLKIAFSGMEKVEIGDYEIKSGGKSYTYLLVEHYRAIYPDLEIFFLVGGDMLTDFKTWKNPDRILKSARLAVCLREGFSTDVEDEKKYFTDRFGDSFTVLKYVGENLSSTKIRLYAMLSLPLDGISIKGVSEYITENDVYGGGETVGFLKANLTEKRLIHTAGVAISALKKAKDLGLDENKVLTAPLLHDCAKYLKKEDYPEFTMPTDVPAPVEHAFLGAYVAENVLGVSDAEIIDAIRYHTSGKANMTMLGKLIFVADMIEEGRNYEGVEKLRVLFDKDFNECFVECLREETLHLKNKKAPIYTETLNAYKYYVTENKGK